MNGESETGNGPCGIYIHVPFCVKKCAYCDFYSITSLDKIPLYVEAVKTEIERAAIIPVSANASASVGSGVYPRPVGEGVKPSPTKAERADSIYFGGGTPSLLASGQVSGLMDAIYLKFDIAAGAEVTIEVNPGTVSFEKLSAYRQAGVNRLSIGVQSFSDAFLAFLSRIHNAAEAVQCVEMARSAGFDNIGLDLIYGLPGQTARQWQADLQAAVELRPEHLSCYMLTYEPGTRLTMDLKKNRLKALPEGEVAELYDITVGYLAEKGWLQYEVSNFSTAISTRSRHNQKYWTHAPYIGLGPAAHSFIRSRRSWNVRSVDGYVRQIKTGESPVEGVEQLDRQQLMMETIYLRLRCVDGIDITAFENRFDADFETLFATLLNEFLSAKYLEIANNRCRLTRRGMLFADSIASRFIDLI